MMYNVLYIMVRSSKMTTARALFADEVLQNPYPKFEELLNRGAVLFAMDSYEAAVASYDRFLALRPAAPAGSTAVPDPAGQPA